MSIKPVAYVHLAPDEFSQDYDVLFWEKTQVGTKLYAIPETHRIVSVDDLRSMQWAFDDNYAVFMANKVRAIIDNK